MRPQGLAQDGRRRTEAGANRLFHGVAGDKAQAGGKQLGPLDAAAIEGERAARIEGAARRRIERRGQLALQDDALAFAAPGRRSASPTAAPAYRDARRREDRRRAGPARPARPRYITITSSAMWRTTREIVADEEIGEAELAPAGRPAGSAPAPGSKRRAPRPARRATRSFGLEHQRAGDGDALALAAREHVRIAVVVLGPQADLAPSSPRARSRALGRAQRRC